MLRMDRKNTILAAFAVLAFLYAVLGNFIALPGYLRFLERGATSAAGNSLDWAVVIGATRTIAWMLAFNLGAICLYFAVLRTRCPGYLKHGAIIAAIWMLFWIWPELPRPTTVFFVLFGSLILLAILLGSCIAAGSESTPTRSERGAFYLATAALFFAFATWDACGLGSTGRILHPEQVVLARSQTLLQTQIIKLMLALCCAWLFAALSLAGWREKAGSAQRRTRLS
jgi:hypothetical protein